MKRPGHSWRWAMLDGGAVRRTAVVPFLRSAGFEGGVERFVEVDPAVLVALCECADCHAIFAEEQSPTHGGPARRAYGYALDALLVGHGVPACEPGVLVREGCRGDEAPAERRAA